MSFTFTTLSKKKYQASRLTLYFVSNELEEEYRLYLAKQSIRPFMVTAALVPLWAFFMDILFRVTNYWDTRSIPCMFYIPVIAMVWGLCSFVFARIIIKRSHLLQYVELLCISSMLIYVGLVILFIHAYMVSLLGNKSRTYIEWVSCLMVTFSVCHRTRLPPIVFGMILIVIADTIINATIEKIDPVIELAGRLAVLLTTMLTVIIFIYQAEYNLRLTFLNEHEYESWKIETGDIYLDDLIGTGTFGEVYKGEYKGFTVAIKKIIPKNKLPSPNTSQGSSNQVKISLVNLAGWMKSLWVSKLSSKSSRKEEKRAEAKVFDKFEAEIRLMCGLRHPNIVTFMGACLKKPDMLLVTEFCELGSLFEFLVDQEYKPIDLDRKLDFIAGSAYGLQYLHQQNPPILHRDFKSLNILIDIHFNVKVCDFGLCDFASDLHSSFSTKKTRNTTLKNKSKDRPKDEPKIIGTIPWVAPEIFLKKPHTEKSDLFSLGVVMWEIIFEQHPYMTELNEDGLTVAELVSKIVQENYRPKLNKHGFPQEIIELMVNLWLKNPLSRPHWTQIIASIDQAKENFRKDKGNLFYRKRNSSVSSDGIVNARGATRKEPFLNDIKEEPSHLNLPFNNLKAYISSSGNYSVYDKQDIIQEENNHKDSISELKVIIEDTTDAAEITNKSEKLDTTITFTKTKVPKSFYHSKVLPIQKSFSSNEN